MPFSKLLLIILTVLGAFRVDAQVAFNGTITGLPYQQVNVILEYFHEDGWKNLQIIKDVKDGKISASINPDHTGQYRMRLSVDPKKWGDFIIVKDKIPTGGYNFTINFSDLKGEPVKIENGKEHEAYASVMPLFHEVTLNPDSLLRNDELMLRREKQLAEVCRQAVAKYPDTYTAKVLASVIPLPYPAGDQQSPISNDSIFKYQCLHAFDELSLKDENVLNHIALIRRLNLGYNFYGTTGRQEIYIDALMKKALIGEEMTAYMFKFLLDKMIDHRDEKGLNYLITWYASDCSESDHVEDGVKNMLKALDHCKPGNTIEFLTLPDISGKMISSKEIFSKNKITIIMFWKGSCDHCREFDPVLKKLYTKYHPQGIEVLAIGTDKVEEQWRTAATEINAPWPSVFLAFNQRKDFNKRFPVPGTPTLMAVDSQGKILRRMIMRSKTEEAILEMMQEQNH